ncbi:MAG: 50S ribosomal protein L29 [Clostridiales bacterium]|nr:50S ribosomal protein L29 [Clostridiales bacterium]
MKARELRELSEVDLAEKLSDLKKELFNLRFQQATNSLENPMQIRAVKKDIARVKLIARQAEISQKGKMGGERTYGN